MFGTQFEQWGWHDGGEVEIDCRQNTFLLLGLVAKIDLGKFYMLF